MSGLVVNGRFLRGTPTGVHRVARPLLAAAKKAGLTFDLRVPPERAAAGLRGQLWEQLALPAAAGGRTVLSLANTAPLAARHGVVMVHDLAPLVGPQWFPPSMHIYGRLALAAARRADHVLTVSSTVAGELSDRGVGAPISVIRQAVDGVIPGGPADVNAVRQRLDLSSSYVVLVGFADPRKDAVTAVAAHVRALRHRPHELVLVGLEHPNFAPVRLPDLPSVRRAGYLDDAALSALLTGAAALVYPSRYEGFGRPPLEAWACGIPALVSDLPSIREATSERATYLPPGDVDRWSEGIIAALDGDLPVPAPDTWTWDDAAGQLLAALGEGS